MFEIFLRFRNYLTSSLVLISLSPLSLWAQDTRTVTEPKIPETCNVLAARYHSTNGVLDAQADAACAKDSSACDTSRVQVAIVSCSARAHGLPLAVVLKAEADKNAFLLQPIQMKENVAVVVEKGVTAFASTNPRDYDLIPGACGTKGTTSRGCKPLFSVTEAKHVSLIGPGTIDGRGGAIMQGSTQSCWQVARAAEPELQPHSCPRLLVANQADDLTLYKIMLKNSPNFHVVVNGADGFTAWGVKIDTPEDARNTDGIDPGNSKNITITQSWIRTGDDNVAIKSGGNGTHNITVSHNHFYVGHGISIGSGTYEGVSNMLVQDLVMQDTANGARIKSDVTRGGLVENIRYENICMQNVKAVIGISPFYNDTTIDPFQPTRFKGDRIPHYKGIVLRNIHSVTPGTVLLAGWDAEHATEATLDNVVVDGLKKEDIHMQFDTIHLGPGKVSFTPWGKEVKILPVDGKATPALDCSGKFVPFPQD